MENSLTKEQIIQRYKNSGLSDEDAIIAYEAKYGKTYSFTPKIIKEVENTERVFRGVRKEVVEKPTKNKKEFLWLVTNRITSDKILFRKLSEISEYIKSPYSTVKYNSKKDIFIIGDFKCEKIKLYIKSHSNLIK